MKNEQGFVTIMITLMVLLTLTALGISSVMHAKIASRNSQVVRFDDLAFEASSAGMQDAIDYLRNNSTSALTVDSHDVNYPDPADGFAVVDRLYSGVMQPDTWVIVRAFNGGSTGPGLVYIYRSFDTTYDVLDWSSGERYPFDPPKNPITYLPQNRSYLLEVVGRAVSDVTDPNTSNILGEWHAFYQLATPNPANTEAGVNVQGRSGPNAAGQTEESTNASGYITP